MAKPQSLRILCFGASLVRGHTENGTKATPYATWMKKKLEGHGSKEVQADVDGVSGDMVTRGGYKSRMEGKCMYQSLRTSLILIRYLAT